MHAFRDCNGRDWAVIIDVAAVRSVRKLLAVDLYSLVDDGMAGLAKLLGDPVMLVDVLYILCRDAAEKAGVSDEDFGRLFRGDSIAAAADAFLAEYTDFFPDAARRAAIGKVLEKARAVDRLQIKRLTAAIEAMDPASVEKQSSGSSFGSRESSGSTPVPSP